MKRKLVHHNRRHHYITELSSGAMRIEFAPSRNCRPFYLPSPESFKAKLERQKGKETSGDISRLRYFGIALKANGSVQAGREALGIAPITKNVTKAEVRTTLQEIWPQKVCKAYIENGEGELTPFSVFRKKYCRIHHALSRNPAFKGIQRTIDAYYPGLYHLIRKTTNGSSHLVDERELKREIQRAYNEGAVISRNGLCHSENMRERRIGALIVRMMKEENKERNQDEKYSFMGLAAQVGMYKENELRLTSRARQELAQCAERITEFYLVWAGITGYDALHIVTDEVFRRKGKRLFAYADAKEGRADLRMSDTAVEVKTGAHALDRVMQTDIIAKYGVGKATWKDTGAPFDKTLLFMHTPVHFYNKYRPELRKAGITVISYDAFHLALQDLVSKLQTSVYKSELDEVTPSAHGDLEAVVRAHAYIGNKANVYGRLAHADMLTWTRNYVTALIEQGKVRYERKGEGGKISDDCPF